MPEQRSEHQLMHRDIEVSLINGSKLTMKSSNKQLTLKNSAKSAPLPVNPETIFEEVLLTLEAALIDIQMRENQKRDDKEALEIYRESRMYAKNKLEEAYVTIQKQQRALENIAKIKQFNGHTAMFMQETAQAVLKDSSIGIPYRQDSLKELHRLVEFSGKEG